MPETHNKLWGREEWHSNDDSYCMKTLFLWPGFQSSMHYHKVKKETFLVVAGKVKLEYMPHYRRSSDFPDVIHKVYLQPYQSFELPPFMPHRFTAIGGDAVIVESSTKHSDEDVVRLEESKPVER